MGDIGPELVHYEVLPVTGRTAAPAEPRSDSAADPRSDSAAELVEPEPAR